MKSNLWTKTILSVYKYLERIAGAIDKLVDRQALNSYYMDITKDNSVMAVANRIIELSERKVKLINIKVLTEKTLESMDKTLAQILIEKYIDNDSGEEIANRHNFAQRTYYRRQNQAEESFASILSKEGFDDKKLNEYLKGEGWIIEVYNRFENKENDEMFFEEDIFECV